MKTLLALLLISSSLYARTYVSKVVYGIDNRKDPYAVKNRMMKAKALSTAAMIDAEELKPSSKRIFKISGETLYDQGVCRTQRFSRQVTKAVCSGFLVAPDVLVTAGHCVTNQDDCNNYRWVFDYTAKKDIAPSIVVEERKTFSCKNIIKRVQDESSMLDFAIIKLDRLVTDRRPLSIRTSGTIPDRAPLFVIGHPSGLPTKVADGASVRSNDNEAYFVANLDTFGGNSGSAVFNAKTGDVEGILVRGETDYVPARSGCYVVNVCSNPGCGGEESTRISAILPYL